MRSNFPKRRLARRTKALEYLKSHYVGNVLPKRFNDKKPTEKELKAWQDELKAMITTLENRVKNDQFAVDN